MQIGIDSFAATESTNSRNGKQNADSIKKLIERIKKADEVGLDASVLVSTTEKNF